VPHRRCFDGAERLRRATRATARPARNRDDEHERCASKEPTDRARHAVLGVMGLMCGRHREKECAYVSTSVKLERARGAPRGEARSWDDACWSWTLYYCVW
jgi:hypothetical protein